MASVEGGFDGVRVLGLGSAADSDSPAIDEGKRTANGDQLRDSTQGKSLMEIYKIEGR